MTDTDTLRKLIEVEQMAHLWGQPYTITPRLVEEVFGNGERLIWLAPLATRPNYYAVRIDSAWDITWGEFVGEDGESVDWVEDVYCAIEDEYGNGEWDEEQPEANPLENYREFPALRLDCGCSWGELEWPEGARVREEEAHAR